MNKKKTIILVSVILVLCIAATILGILLIKPKCEIEFNSNGGSEVSSLTIKKGGLIEKPENPVKEDYDFAGWFLDEELTKEWNFETDKVEDKNIKLYAKWVEDNFPRYIVTFKNGDEVVDTQRVKQGKSAIAPVAPYKPSTEKYEYTFTNWDKAFDNITSDLVVNAVFSEGLREFSVFFYGDGIYLGSQRVKYGESITELTKTPTKKPTKEFYYEFVGWDKEVDNITSDTYLYAEFEEKVPEDEYFRYILQDDGLGYCLVRKENVTLPAEIVVPASFHGTNVTMIGASTFDEEKYEDRITSITFEDINLIKSIDYYAFRYSKGLGDLDFSNGALTQIGVGAFDASSITSVKLPSCLGYIGFDGFRSCNKLKSVEFGENTKLNYINEWVFDNCTSLESIVIPKSVKTIYNWAFYNCESLKNVIIEEGSKLTEINSRAFAYCGVLENINIPDSVELIGYAAFYECLALKEIKLPSSLKEIGENAFNNASIESVTISSSVETIGEYAFASSNLASVSFENESKLTEFSEGVFAYCTSLNSIEIPKSITTIQDNVFKYSGLTSIVIPNSVESMGYGCFYNCVSLSEVIFEEGCKIETIASSTFNKCTSLNSIEIPNSVTVIDSYAFAESGLKSAVIPNSITTTYEGIFSHCGKLEEVAFEEDCQIAEIPYYTFEYCSSLKNIEIPSSVTTIAYHAFYYSGLESIEVSDNVTDIKDGAFTECNSLTSVKLGSGLQNMSGSAFCYCDEIEAIEVAKENSKYHVENNCLIETATNTLVLGGKVVEIPSYITHIGVDAFYGRALTSINIHANIESIAAGAFSCCRLRSVIIPKTVITMGSCSFDYNIGATLYCEAESKPEGWENDWWCDSHLTTNMWRVVWGYTGK